MSKLISAHKRLSRSVIVSLIAAGLLLAAVITFILWPRDKGQYRIPETSAWQTGDIFFSSGTSWKSDVVRLFGGTGEYHTSHCGIVMMVQGKPMLVHMSTDKGEITLESVEDYGPLNGATSVRAMRLKTMLDTVALRRRLECLLATHKEFDNSFDHADTTQYYCTELVVREFQALGVEAFAPLLNQTVIYPADIERSPSLTSVP